MATSEERALFLVEQQAAGRDSILEGLLDFLVQLLTALVPEDFHDPRRVQQVVEQVVPVVRTARAAEAGLAWQYLDAMLEQGGRAVPAPHTTKVEDLRGTPDHEVWQRVLQEYRYRAQTGLLHDQAMERTLRRAETMAADDLALAMRVASREHAAATPGVTALRRVVHPELSRTGTCGLCLAASDRLYWVRKLLPVHGGCKCTVAEVVGSHDPGNSLNNLSLGDVYGAAGGTDKDALKKVRYRIDEHGELGPVLVPKTHHFKGPREAAADAGTKWDDQEKRTRQIAGLTASIEDLLARQQAGEDVSLPLEHQRRRLKRLRAA